MKTVAPMMWLKPASLQQNQIASNQAARNPLPSIQFGSNQPIDEVELGKMLSVGMDQDTIFLGQRLGALPKGFFGAGAKDKILQWARENNKLADLKEVLECAKAITAVYNNSELKMELSFSNSDAVNRFWISTMPSNSTTTLTGFALATEMYLDPKNREAFREALMRKRMGNKPFIAKMENFFKAPATPPEKLSTPAPALPTVPPPAGKSPAGTPLSLDDLFPPIFEEDRKPVPPAPVATAPAPVPVPPPAPVQTSVVPPAPQPAEVKAAPPTKPAVMTQDDLDKLVPPLFPEDNKPATEPTPAPVAVPPAPAPVVETPPQKQAPAPAVVPAPAPAVSLDDLFPPILSDTPSTPSSRVPAPPVQSQPVTIQPAPAPVAKPAQVHTPTPARPIFKTPQLAIDKRNFRDVLLKTVDSQKGFELFCMLLNTTSSMVVGNTNLTHACFQLVNKTESYGVREDVEKLVMLAQTLGSLSESQFSAINAKLGVPSPDEAQKFRDTMASSISRSVDVWEFKNIKDTPENRVLLTLVYTKATKQFDALKAALTEVAPDSTNAPSLVDSFKELGNPFNHFS